MPVERADQRRRPLREPGERLQKVMAQAGVASRRKCEEYIVAGRVKVNGKVITELGTRVRPDVDLVEVDGQLIAAQERVLLYYLLYKPVGYLSTVSDPHGRDTALTLVPSEERLYPVGRLDFNSEGLLLFTNDGELAFRLMHPRYQHEKEYLVLVHGPVSDVEIAQLRKGVTIGEERLHAQAEVRRTELGGRWRSEPTPPGCSWLQVVLREGQKRQIRYMLEAVQHPVERLVRVRMGELPLGSLRPGQGRWLARKEAQALRQSVGLEHGKFTARTRADERVGRSAHGAGRTAGVRTKDVRKRTRVEKDHDRPGRPGRIGQEHRRRHSRP